MQRTKLDWFKSVQNIHEWNPFLKTWFFVIKWYKRRFSPSHCAEHSAEGFLGTIKIAIFQTFFHSQFPKLFVLKIKEYHMEIVWILAIVSQLLKFYTLYIYNFRKKIKSGF